MAGVYWKTRVKMPEIVRLYTEVRMPKYMIADRLGISRTTVKAVLDLAATEQKGKEEAEKTRRILGSDK